jgi:hypothetical protein
MVLRHHLRRQIAVLATAGVAAVSFGVLTSVASADVPLTSIGPCNSGDMCIYGFENEGGIQYSFIGAHNNWASEFGTVSKTYCSQGNWGNCAESSRNAQGQTDGYWTGDSHTGTEYYMNANSTTTNFGSLNNSFNSNQVNV